VINLTDLEDAFNLSMQRENILEAIAHANRNPGHPLVTVKGSLRITAHDEPGREPFGALLSDKVMRKTMLFVLAEIEAELVEKGVAL